MRKVSIVIPVYNNERTLRPLYEQIVAVFKDVSELDYELLFINDGSSDGSKRVILELRTGDERVKYVGLTRNFGQVPALCAGLQMAKGDACILRSADLQDPVSLISEFIAGWLKGNSIVIGHREKRTDGFTDRVLSKMFYQLIGMVNSKMPSGGFDYCLLDKRAVSELNRFRYRNRFLQGDILSLGYATLLIPYERQTDESASFRSKTSFSFKLKYALDGLFNATHLPTRIMMLIGGLTILTGVACTIFCRKESFFESGLGDAELITSTILVVGGIIMIMLGLLGEYLWRIHDEIRERPQFIIEEQVD